MSQCSLFGFESYQQTRQPVRGRACSREQLDMFRQAKAMKAKPALPFMPKPGQRFRVERTGRVVTFVRQIGSDTLWNCNDLWSPKDILWRATPEQLADAVVRPLL